MPSLFAGGVDCGLEVLAVEEEFAVEFAGFAAEALAVFVEAVAGVWPFVFVVPFADVGGVAEFLPVGAGVGAGAETLDAAGAVVALDALVSVVLDFEREDFFLVPSATVDVALELVVSVVVAGAAAASAAPPAAAFDFFEVFFAVVVFVLSVDALSVEAVAPLPVAPAVFLLRLLFLDVEALDEVSVVDVVALLSAVESVGAFFFFFVLLVLVSV
jgi:hypothetical protein